MWHIKEIYSKYTNQCASRSKHRYNNKFYKYIRDNNQQSLIIKDNFKKKKRRTVKAELKKLWFPCTGFLLPNIYIYYYFYARYQGYSPAWLYQFHIFKNCDDTSASSLAALWSLSKIYTIFYYNFYSLCISFYFALNFFPFFATSLLYLILVLI